MVIQYNTSQYSESGFMSITEAAPGDYESFLCIDRQSFNTHWDKESWKNVLFNPSCQTLISTRCKDGRRAGPIEGYIVYGEGEYTDSGLVTRGGEEAGRVACILSFAVLRDSRRQGIGTRLLNAIPYLGHRDVHVHVAIYANEALEMFTRSGFEATERRTHNGVDFIHLVREAGVRPRRETSGKEES